MHKVKPKKSLGQNFLTDDNVLTDIVNILSLRKTDQILEIGAGYGALTHELVKYVENIDIVEIDGKLANILTESFSPRVEVHNIDALCFNLERISNKKNHIRVVGNLPYNISTLLLFKFFEKINIIKDMHFLVQKEVAERITAKPGTKSYGRLSILAQYYCETEEMLVVQPESFYPKPKILSSFIRLIPRQEKLQVKSFEQFKYLLKKSFQSRRKKIKNNLTGLIDFVKFEKELPHINLNLRAENISIEDYIKISDHISKTY